MVRMKSRNTISSAQRNLNRITAVYVEERIHEPGLHISKQIWRLQFFMNIVTVSVVGNKQKQTNLKISYCHELDPKIAVFRVTASSTWHMLQLVSQWVIAWHCKLHHFCFVHSWRVWNYSIQIGMTTEATRQICLRLM